MASVAGQQQADRRQAEAIPEDDVGDRHGIDEFDFDSVADAIDQLVTEKAPAAFAQRDKVLVDLVQGMEALQTMAETCELVKPQESLSDGSESIAEERKLLTYPKSLVSSFSLKDSPQGRARLEQILDTPHAVSCHRGGWFSVNLRRKKGELSQFRRQGKAKGREAVTKGKVVNISRAGQTAKYRRQTHREVPRSAEGEEGKYVCDVRMALDAFCNIFHTSCPEHNLIDAFHRGRVQATFFGDGDQSAAEIVQNLEKYFLKKLRCGRIDNIIDGKIRIRHRHGTASKRNVPEALSEIFLEVVGDALESVGFWSVVTERVRCIVQFQIRDDTQLTPRHDFRVANDNSIQRIRKFRRQGGVLGQTASEILSPKPIPTNLIKREADREAIMAYQNSLKGRRRRIAQANQTKRLRKEDITEVCWVVLTGFDPKRRRTVSSALQKHAKMTADDVEWALKWGVPYYLLRQDNPDLSLADGRALKDTLEEAGCTVIMEREQLNAI